MQSEVATHAAGPMIVEGAPGTGKSAALDQRFVHLVESGVAPASIAVVTATRLSAETHRRSIEQLVPGPYEELVVVTWPQLAERLLRSWPVEAGLDPDFEVAGPAERLAMLLVRFDELPLRHHEIRGNPVGLMRRLLVEIDLEKAALGDRGPAGAFAGDPPRRAEFEQLVAFHDRDAERARLPGFERPLSPGRQPAGRERGRSGSRPRMTSRTCWSMRPKG